MLLDQRRTTTQFRGGLPADVVHVASQASPRGGLSTDIFRTVSQTAQLLNFPLAQEVIQQLNDLYVSLKIPEGNAVAAQSLIDGIERTIAAMCEAAGLLDDLGSFDNDYSTLLGDLQQFYDYLEITLARLRSIQNYGTTSKLLFRMNIHYLIQETREELMNATWELLVRLATLGLAQALHNKHALLQVQRDVRVLEGSCHQQRDWLEREVRSLTRRSDATIVSSVSIVLFE